MILSRQYQTIILCFSLLFVGILTYSPHWDYPYPLHLDEWQHIARITYFNEQTARSINALAYTIKDYFFPPKNLITNPSFEQSRTNEKLLPKNWIVLTSDNDALDNREKYLTNFSHNQDALKEEHIPITKSLFLTQNAYHKLQSIAWDLHTFNNTLPQVLLRTHTFTILPGNYNLSFTYKTTDNFTGGFYVQLSIDPTGQNVEAAQHFWYFADHKFWNAQDYLTKEFDYNPTTHETENWSITLEGTNTRQPQQYPLPNGWTKITITNIPIPFNTTMLVTFYGYCPVNFCNGLVYLDDVHLIENRQIKIFSPLPSLFQNPYLKGHPYQPNLEPGFHVILSLFSKFTPFDLILSWKYLPALFAALTAFTLYLFVKKVTKHYWISIFTIFFLAGLKSNINVLGLWFFTPLTMALPLLFLTLYLSLISLEKQNRNYYILLTVLYILLAAIHPLSALFSLMILFTYLAIHWKIYKTQWKNLTLLLIPPLIMLLVFLIADWKGAISSYAFIQNFFIFKKGWGKFEYLYQIPAFYGILSTLFAFVGIFVAVRTQYQRILLPGVFIAAALTFLFAQKSFSIFIPYQRALYFLLLSLTPLSAIGLLTTARYFTQKNMKTLAGILLILALAFHYYHYATPAEEFKLYHLLTPKDYQALQAIQGLFDNKQNVTFLASPLFSATIYPVIKQPVLLLTPGAVEGRLIPQLENFPAQNCSTIYNIKEQREIDIIYLRGYTLSCPQLKQIYQNEEIHAYA